MTQEKSKKMNASKTKPQRPKFQKEKILLFQNSRNMGFNRQIYDLFQKDAFPSVSVVFHCFARLKSIRLKKKCSPELRVRPLVNLPQFVVGSVDMVVMLPRKSAAGPRSHTVRFLP
jgi:hypothetical protein